VCPGVRPSWAATGDQSRIATPKAAFDAGASHIVIGRPITDAEDPIAAYERIIEEL
jgi:orotidine-5'-phosphate decarboxylase